MGAVGLLVGAEGLLELPVGPETRPELHGEISEGRVCPPPLSTQWGTALPGVPPIIAALSQLAGGRPTSVMFSAASPVIGDSRTQSSGGSGLQPHGRDFLLLRAAAGCVCRRCRFRVAAEMAAPGDGGTGPGPGSGSGSGSGLKRLAAAGDLRSVLITSVLNLERLEVDLFRCAVLRPPVPPR